MLSSARALYLLLENVGDVVFSSHESLSKCLMHSRAQRSTPARSHLRAQCSTPAHPCSRIQRTHVEGSTCTSHTCSKAQHTCVRVRGLNTHAFTFEGSTHACSRSRIQRMHIEGSTHTHIQGFTCSRVQHSRVHVQGSNRCVLRYRTTVLSRITAVVNTVPYWWV